MGAVKQHYQEEIIKNGEYYVFRAEMRKHGFTDEQIREAFINKLRGVDYGQD